jgi:hypothetical protein
MTFNRKLFIACIGLLSVIYLSAQETAKQTTPPLKGELEVTEHPVAHIWMSSTATDGDFSLPVIGEEKVIESERSSKLAIGFIVAVIIVLVIAFTLYVRSRLTKK